MNRWEDHSPVCPLEAGCTVCNPTSTARAEASDVCGRCNGVGRVVDEVTDEVMLCPDLRCCGGYVESACKRCIGDGCAHCGETGSEATRRELQDCGEHPVVSVGEAS